MIGISEGIVLADRYRLTRRLGERTTGASWLAVDLETGTDVWVQFADHGGLAKAAEVIRGLPAGRPPAFAASLPTVLDTGELRMVVNSRALAALRGGTEAYSTHAEIVVEFAVVKELAGRALPAKIQRRALPPADALTIAATLAAALEAALADAGSHGWLDAGSVWLVRRGGCALDLAQGLAYPDGSPIELELQAGGYFAPERFAAAKAKGAKAKAGAGADAAAAAAAVGAAGAAAALTTVGTGSKATEAADVFSLGWMLYEMLIGHAELLSEREHAVADAGEITMVESLLLWRERARAHLTELVAADSALGVLVLGAISENAAKRPTLADFAQHALATGKAMAGAAPLIAPVIRSRNGAKQATEIAAVAAAALGAEALAAEALAAESAGTADVATESALATEAAATESAEIADVAAESALAAAAIAGAEGLAAEELASEAVGAAAVAEAAEAESASGAAEFANAGADSAESSAAAVIAEAETVVIAAAAAAGIGAAFAQSSGAGVVSASVEAAELGSVGAAGVSGQSAASESAHSAETERELERLSHRARLATIGGTAVAVVALGVGIAVGYVVGHHGNSTTILTTAGTNAAGPLAAASPSSGALAAPVPAVTVTVTVTASEAAAAPSPSASASASASAAGAGAGASSGASTPAASPTAISSPALPTPTSSAEAISELKQEIQYLVSTGETSSSTASHLTTAVDTLQSSLGTNSYSNSLSSLTSMVRSAKAKGLLSSSGELRLESILGYFYAGSGS